VTRAERLAIQRIRAIRALNVRGIRLLHLADVGMIYILLIAITGILTLLGPDFNAWAHLPRYVWSYAVVALLHLAVFYFGGLYDRERRLGQRPGLPKIVALVWVASSITGLISWLLGEFLLPRRILVVFALLAPLGLAANRWLSRRLRLSAEGPPRVLLVGDDEDVAKAVKHLADAGELVEVAGATPSVVDLQRKVTDSDATDVLLLDRGFLGDLYTGPLARLESAGVSALQLVTPQDSLLGLRSVGEIGGMPFVGLSTHVLPPSQARLKRLLDLVIITLALPVVLPLAMVATAYTAALVGRPLLFVQQRVGRDGRLFPMLKFRTMRPDAEDGIGPVQAAVNDPRIIRGMGWLRATRLDELPQLWNVLRGQMSLVGPRPERLEELHEYERQFAGYSRRHQVPPGITGLAQVYGRYHTDIGYKLGHDLQYLANWSPVLDMQIMARTVWVVITRRV
jgi:exopolysaccharide biosynthesis polyprenyl glycosylphosphotransferase